MSVLKYLSVVFAFAFIASYINSSTVTLSGTCTNITNSNGTAYMNFTLINTGDGAAQNLLLTTSPYGLYSQNIENLSLLGSNDSHTYTFHFSNLSRPGSYGIGIYVSYLQGGENFVVAFPCIVNYKAASFSTVKITGFNLNGSKLSITAMNLGRKNTTARLYFIFPPIIKINPSISNISLAAASTKQVTAILNDSSLAGHKISINLAAMLEYNEGGIEYTSFSILPISFNAQKSVGISIIAIVLYSTIGLILALFALLVYAILKKKYKKVK